MRVDQLVPAFHQGDAIGDAAFHLKRFFLAQGFQSQIYCFDRDPGLEDESSLFVDFPEPGSDDVTILHYALPSPLSSALRKMSSKKVIIHHNITPPEFFEAYSPEMMRISRLGREELLSLAPDVDLALADSEYNRQELLAAGFQNAVVFPLFVDFSRYQRPINRFVFDLFRDDRLNILFVGRIVPNKKIDELIKVVFYYKKYISPLVRLIVVGKTTSLPGYYQALVRLADEFYLKPDELCFTGHIPDSEMYALYRASDVFLSLSEHEGFGLPFLESMLFELPIIAYNCTAVPHTLGEAGILIDRKNVDFVAELVHVVGRDTKLKEKLVSAQARQLESYQRKKMDDFLIKILNTLARGND
jgi:glycosyltransferase involved in cell wall biosynthesis